MKSAAGKVLFFSDFSPNPNGFGGSQTAFNLIARIRAEKFTYINKLYFNEIRPDDRWAWGKDFDVFTYTLHIYTNTRVERFLSKARDLINMNYFFVSRKMKRNLTAMKPDSVVFISNSPFIFNAAIKLKTIIPGSRFYFFVMDDYKYYNRPLYKKKMAEAFNNVDGWFPISENMRKQFQLQFPALVSKQALVFQNPVDASRMRRRTNLPSGNLRFVYAGSVYPIHLEGLILFVKSLRQLNTKSVSLDIYTKLEFRKHFQEFENDHVRYKGVVVYEELHRQLGNYDFGLVTESFSEDNSYLAKNSVQTKIKDYILGGCVPVAIGPEWGASHDYVRAHNIGYYYTGENSIDDCSKFVRGLLEPTDFSERINAAQDFILSETQNLSQALHEILISGSHPPNHN